MWYRILFMSIVHMKKMPTISGVHSGFWINWGEFIPSFFVAEIFIVRAGGLVGAERYAPSQ
jgi:hypothetical protein